MRSQIMQLLLPAFIKMHLIIIKMRKAYTIQGKTLLAKFLQKGEGENIQGGGDTKKGDRAIRDCILFPNYVNGLKKLSVKTICVSLKLKNAGIKSPSPLQIT